jgi:hypothetical protein
MENRTLEVTYLRLVEISKNLNLGEHCEKYFNKSSPNSARKLLGVLLPENLRAHLQLSV